MIHFVKILIWQGLYMKAERYEIANNYENGIGVEKQMYNKLQGN